MGYSLVHQPCRSWTYVNVLRVLVRYIRVRVITAYPRCFRAAAVERVLALKCRNLDTSLVTVTWTTYQTRCWDEKTHRKHYQPHYVLKTFRSDSFIWLLCLRTKYKSQTQNITDMLYQSIKMLKLLHNYNPLFAPFAIFVKLFVNYYVFTWLCFDVFSWYGNVYRYIALAPLYYMCKEANRRHHLYMVVDPYIVLYIRPLQIIPVVCDNFVYNNLSAGLINRSMIYDKCVPIVISEILQCDTHGSIRTRPLL